MSRVPSPFTAADALVGVGPSPTPAERRARLRAALSNGTLVLPGATDALGVRLIEAAGFDAAYATGAGLANAQFGVPDLGLVSLGEVADHVDRLASASRLPLVVDGDTGFGGPVMTMRAVRRLERAGAAAIQLEDQEMPKRCGHFDSHTLIPAEHMAAKLVAARQALEDDATVLIARTDARSVHDIDEAIRRAQLYVDAGVDVIFVEAPRTVEELEKVGRALTGVPLVVNVVEGGKTPQLSLDEYRAAGIRRRALRQLPHAHPHPVRRRRPRPPARHRRDRVVCRPHGDVDRTPGPVQPARLHRGRDTLRPRWRRAMSEDPGIAPAGLPIEHELPDRVGVLVLGGGLAGAAALLAAAEAGQYAVLLEKTRRLRRVDGALRRAVGLRSSDEQPEQGIADSVELLRGDLLETGDHVNDEALVDLYCERQLDTYRWLKAHGVRYGHIHAASGQSAPRSHPSDTTAMLRALFTAAGRLGARLVPATAVRRILHDGRRVTGVEVERDGERRTVLADAVVLATGGFSRSRRDARAVRPGHEGRRSSPAARATTATGSSWR